MHLLRHERDSTGGCRWAKMYRTCLTIISVVLAHTAALPEARSQDIGARLSPAEVQAVSDAVERGIKWLATQQNANGSFNSNHGPDMHTTSYAVMAFMSQGYQPGRGRYGGQITKAIEWLLSSQREDGAFTNLPADKFPLTHSHALSGQTLCLAHGSTSGEDADRIGKAIDRALIYSRKIQTLPKLHDSYRGGWAYSGGDGRPLPDWSAVPTTSWELVFMRSAQDAGFEVPQTWVDEGLEFIDRCYKPGPSVEGDRRLPVGKRQGVFLYYPERAAGHPIWGNFTTTSAAILALQQHGRGRDPKVIRATSWLIAHPIPPQGKIPNFYRTCFTSSWAISQVDQNLWENNFPKLVRMLLPYQSPDGRFRLDRSLGWSKEPRRGPANYTALAILCLTPPGGLGLPDAR